MLNTISNLASTLILIFVYYNMYYIIILKV